MSVIDLTNQQFGLLTVIQRDFNPHNGREAWWLCQCQCGNQKAVRGSDLRRGRTKSCGCLSKVQAKENIKIAQAKNKETLVSLKDKKFGKLLVISELPERTKDGYRLWQCKCDCGNLVAVNTNALNKGHKLSCGCLTSKGEMLISSILQNNNIDFEQQKSFNNCRFEDTQALAKFDFYVANKYIIEYDGIQHFICTEQDWNTTEHFEKTTQHDKFKNEWCKNNNIPIIRIPYWKFETLIIDDLLLETSNFVIKQ